MNHKVVFYIFLPVGLLLTGIAYYLAYLSQDAKSNWEQHKATVIEVEKRRNSDNNGYVYMPIFEYNIEGQLLTEEHNVASNPPSYKVGDRVDILVHPSDPNQMMVNSFWGLYLWSVVLGILGAIFGIVGTAGIIFSKRPQIE